MLNKFVKDIFVHTVQIMSRKNGLEYFQIFSGTRLSCYYRRNPDRVWLNQQVFALLHTHADVALCIVDEQW